ncbi:hypothetical protein [Flocculibacter collagenilyticus]|uniref:hypothetical protein n=1 Tax=Flocculibacter collagenilyticus TaxID=2744479 RepID=UPI0018F64CAD|nr:hypothetical protein [Flocculibacter collagenilyticus]
MTEVTCTMNVEVSITVNKKLFRKDRVSFDTSLNESYEIGFNNGSFLKNENEFLYSYQKGSIYPYYKAKPCSIKTCGAVKEYPLIVKIPGFSDIEIDKPQWNKLRWTISIQEKIVAILILKTSIWPFKEEYLLQVEKVNETKTDLLMFVLLLMYDRINDYTGT